MQEHRRYVRFHVPVLVEFPHPTNWRTERSFTSDISEAGLRFPTSVGLQVGQELPLTLQLPFGPSEFHATGEVVWVREIARLGTTHYEVGIRFRWMEDPDRQRLSRHLSTLLPRKV